MRIIAWGRLLRLKKYRKHYRWQKNMVFKLAGLRNLERAVSEEQISEDQEESRRKKVFGLSLILEERGKNLDKNYTLNL